MEDPLVYAATFKALSDRADFQSDGLVNTGWPEVLVNSNGICLRLEAAEMLWLTLTTNEVAIPR